MSLSSATRKNTHLELKIQRTARIHEQQGYMTSYFQTLVSTSELSVNLENLNKHIYGQQGYMNHGAYA